MNEKKSARGKTPRSKKGKKKKDNQTGRVVYLVLQEILVYFHGCFVLVVSMGQLY